MNVATSGHMTSSDLPVGRARSAYWAKRLALSLAGEASWAAEPANPSEALELNVSRETGSLETVLDYTNVFLGGAFKTEYKIDVNLNANDWRSPSVIVLDAGWWKSPMWAPTYVPMPVPVVAPELVRRFRELADCWHRETDVLSSIQRKVIHKAYQRIIGLGPDALHLVLAELEDSGGFWFWALAAISGDDPAADATSYAAARDAWLAWGRLKGLL